MSACNSLLHRREAKGPWLFGGEEDLQIMDILDWFCYYCVRFPFDYSWNDMYRCENIWQFVASCIRTHCDELGMPVMDALEAS